MPVVTDALTESRSVSPLARAGVARHSGDDARTRGSPRYATFPVSILILQSPGAAARPVAGRHRSAERSA